ncbi:MAG: serine/threonine-protein kinase [Spirulinaceae cyanobacterium]
MSYCLNPKCKLPHDSLNRNNKFCRHCGSLLLLQEKYKVIQPLNKGGFGRTFEITNGTENKVLKVLLKNKTKLVTLFRREAEVLGTLRHAGIPKVEKDSYFVLFPNNSDKPLHCLIMEKIEGVNLQQWLRQRNNQPITQELAINWLNQLLEILEQIHQQRYFHRDIKPSNIMLRPNGQLVLIDFGGVRKITDTYVHKLATDKITGFVSHGYTPAEQIGGRAVLQSDFFALGRSFVYLLTGQYPLDFPVDPQSGKLIWRDHAPQITPLMGGLINYLMSPFPERRPQNIQEIWQCLAEIEPAVKARILKRSPDYYADIPTMPAINVGE